MEYNRIPVIFTGRKGTAPPISYKYDQKQKITFEGIYGLPAVFTVDFCNEGDTVTKPEIGTPDGVDIPDEYLQTGRPIKAFFWLTGPNESVQTRYEIEIPVRSRPARSEVTPTPAQRSVIDELIDELNTGVEEAEQSAENAETQALKAEGFAVGTQNGEAVEEESPYYQHNAQYYANLANSKATEAENSAAAAGDAKTAAETAQGKAETAQAGAESAKRQAQELVDGAASEIIQAKNSAVQAVGNAGTAAVQAVNSAGATQTANAKAQADRAETAAGNAVTAKNAAVDAKNAVQNMGVSANTGAEGSQAQVQKTVDPQTGTVTLTFTIPRGNTGETPDFDIGTVSTLEANQPATASITGTKAEPRLNLGIPKGPQGVIGNTPDFEIGTVTTLDYDEDATASITGTPENPVLNLGIPRGAPWKVYTNQYAARWNKETHQMERVGLAVGITTDVTNFAHRGSLNENYNNPFDSIAPWSGMKVCNIDIGLYMALDEGDSLTDCVSAWEGDPDFSWDAASGVWRYTPEFWGRSYESDGYVYYDVSPTEPEEKGYIHYPESIKGRWHGRTVTMTLSGTETSVFLPLPGMPDKQASQIPMHDRAKAYGGTLDNIWTVDADNLLAIVEYADMNMQMALGEGCDAMYRQSSDKFVAAATDSNVVKVNKNNASAFVIPGAIFDIGTSNGGIQKGSFRVVSVEQDPDNSAWLDVTIDGTVTVTTGNFWSVHGICNAKDSDLGSMSGYLGTAGKSNVYYRGAVIYGNLWFYVLGAYRQTGTQHIWIAHDPEEADAYDALDTSVHFDTGLALPVAEGDIQILATVEGVLSAPPFCIGIGGNSTNPVGDHFYTNASAANTVLRVGGNAYYGAYVGPFYGGWYNAASNVYWSCAARPVLKSP